MSDMNMILKVEKKHPDFAREVQALTAAELEARIVALQKGLEESEAHKEANTALADARMAVSELAGPYADLKKAVNLKTRYILELLREKGK